MRIRTIDAQSFNSPAVQEYKNQSKHPLLRYVIARAQIWRSI